MNFKLNVDWKSQSFLILILVSLCQFSASLVTNSIIVMLPDIYSDLAIPVSTLNWISILFFLSLTASSIPLSKVISKYGVKRFTKYAFCALIVSLIIPVLTSDINMFLISRVIQGVAIAVLYISIYMLIVLGMPENETGRALGIVGSLGCIGMTISPSISGFITLFMSWRVAFLVYIPIFIFLLFLIHLIKDEWTDEEIHIDTVGSVIYVLLITFLVYGLSEITSTGAIGLIAFLISVIIFVLYEKRKDNPVYDLKLLKNKNYVIGNYAAMTN